MPDTARVSETELAQLVALCTGGALDIGAATSASSEEGIGSKEMAYIQSLEGNLTVK